MNEVAGALNHQRIETQIFWIGNKAISGCIACKSCKKLNQCVLKDTVNEFLKIAGEYDGFVIGTPVHWGAAAVVSARRAGTTATWDQINKYFALMQMPIISSRYWTIVHGATPEQVQKDLEGMQTMRILGKNMAYFLKCKEAAKNAGIIEPEQETPIFTNFIRESD